MRPLRFLQALRRPRALAIMASLSGHVVLAAAGYAYVIWPSSPTVVVIPVEVVASPFGPGSGSTANTSASNTAGGDQAASDVEPAGPSDEETVPSDQPLESPDRIASKATPVRLPTQPPEIDAGNREVASEIAPPQVSVSIPDPIDPSPVLAKAIDPPSQVKPEIDHAALSIVAIPDSSWAVPTRQPTQQVDVMPLPVVQQPISASIAPPRIVAPTMSPTHRSESDVVVTKRPPLPRTRPAELLLARATNASAPAAQAQRPTMRFSRPRPTLQFESNILAHAPAKPPTQISPDQNLLLAPARLAPTDSSNIRTTGRNIEMTRRGDPTNPTVVPGANPGGGIGADAGADLRPLPGNPAPRYPRLARERGWQGRVVLEVAVIGDGTVNNAKIDQSSGYRVLDQAALQVVRRWRFAVDQPRLPPQGTVVRVPITFKLSD